MDSILEIFKEAIWGPGSTFHVSPQHVGFCVPAFHLIPIKWLLTFKARIREKANDNGN